eukprot:CAMPEP_0177365102 /NCGR_PEP_ID=MMETSP0368-20130122/39140_1 /TAXON_ID=447022 ORGANISM="Scrippsiella hangoei-like, Strain SHHI-4" /NCGR_SAMPLE_ID=MMETSP0368 /ASSEMBLY_ACC=CAM_ASM_000363 /LENGTH=30 /DNA_ID= /DNA_START= /DNA_END= /DNA_ORIENTATION=
MQMPLPSPKSATCHPEHDCTPLCLNSKKAN